MRLQSVLAVAIMAAVFGAAAHGLSARAGGASAGSPPTRSILLLQRVGADSPLDRWLDLVAAISAATTAIGRIG